MGSCLIELFQDARNSSDPVRIFADFSINIWFATPAVHCPRQKANNGSIAVSIDDQRASWIGRANAFLNRVFRANLQYS